VVSMIPAQSAPIAPIAPIAAARKPPSDKARAARKVEMFLVRFSMCPLSPSPPFATHSTICRHFVSSGLLGLARHMSPRWCGLLVSERDYRVATFHRFNTYRTTFLGC
jgi:hypothetical protein